MKVYILTEYTGYSNDDAETIIGVFTKPKYARKFFDDKYGLDTKNKWTKLNSDTRAHRFGERDSYFYVTEYAVQDK